ncbi:MAG: hypothetical protein ABIQ99_14005 [Thermoflexales bacterium]
MASLLDVNILVALMLARHPHSARVIHWLGRPETPGALVCCRVAQMGAGELGKAIRATSWTIGG